MTYNQKGIDYELCKRLTTLPKHKKMTIHLFNSTSYTIELISVNLKNGFIIGVNEDGQYTMIHSASISSINLGEGVYKIKIISDEPFYFESGKVISSLEFEAMTPDDRTKLIIQADDKPYFFDLPPNKRIKKQLNFSTPIASELLTLESTQGTIYIFYLKEQ